MPSLIMNSVSGNFKVTMEQENQILIDEEIKWELPENKGLIASLLSQYNVIIFRSQNLSTKQILSLKLGIGQLYQVDQISNVDSNNAIIAEDSTEYRQMIKANSLWHIDMPMLKSPPLAGVLRPEILPMSRGQTQFADTSYIYHHLPKEIKRLLINKSAAHNLETIRRRAGIVKPSELYNEYGTGNHPVICLDPLSKQASILLSCHTSQIGDLSKEETNQVLVEYFSICAKHAYTHEWQLGDVVIWNNRRTIHRALEYNINHEKRVLWRAELIDSTQVPNAL